MKEIPGVESGVTPRDPGTFAAMLVVLTSVAPAAGYLPARRTLPVDPIVALRTERSTKEPEFQSVE